MKCSIPGNFENFCLIFSGLYVHVHVCRHDIAYTHSTCTVALPIMKKLKEMGERVFALESERTIMQPQLAQTRSLQEKAAALERELLVLSQLYHNQRDELLSIRAHGTGKQEWSQLATALKQEKEGVLPRLHVFRCTVVWLVFTLKMSRVKLFRERNFH